MHGPPEAERYAAAEDDFNEALELYPDFVGSGNPYEGLAAIYRARGDTAALKGVLERFLQRAELAADAARELAGLHEADEAWTDVALNLRRSLNVDPYDLDVRRRLAEAYEKLGRTSEAVTQRRAILASTPSTRQRPTTNSPPASTRTRTSRKPSAPCCNRWSARPATATPSGCCCGWWRSEFGSTGGRVGGESRFVAYSDVRRGGRDRLANAATDDEAASASGPVRLL